MWNYPVVLHKDADSDYGVIVPDLPGCISAGATMDAALAMSREAIELHLEGLIEDGQSPPPPSDVETLRHRRAYRGGTWALVSIEPTRLRYRAKRLSVTMPERVVDAVDRYARKHDMTRSGLLTEAVTRFIRRGDDPAMRKVRRGKPRQNK